MIHKTIIIILFSLSLILHTTSCIPSAPVRTKRPTPDIRPWVENTVTSSTGHTYTYLFHPGPSPDSPSILLLHGSIYGELVWMNMVGLSEKLNVYALQWPNNSLFFTESMEDYSKIAADFLGALKINEVIVVGISAGAFGAIDLAINKDVEVKALIIFSAVMYCITEEEIEKRTSLATKALDQAPDRLRAIIEWRVEDTEPDRAPGEIQLADIYYTRPYPYYYQLFSGAKNQGSTKQATEQVECPTLIAHGTEDDFMPIEIALLTPSVFKDAKIVQFKGYKHSMVFAHGPDFVTLILKFLEQHGLLL